MKAFHDSRNTTYRSPYGAVAPQEEVTLSIDIWESPNATVTLRTWIDGQGEGLYEMKPASEQEPADGLQEGAVRYTAIFTPDSAGTVWYHFIIAEANGATKRYGVPEGKRGGRGQLSDWEPPSFQLTVCDPEADGAPAEINSPAKALIRFVRNEIASNELVETIETARENLSPAAFSQACNVLQAPNRLVTFAELVGVDLADDPRLAEEGITLVRPGAGDSAPDEDEGEDASESDAEEKPLLEDWQIGLAKGRLWCASLIQMLMLGLPAAEGAGEADETAYEAEITGWGLVDPDCESILRNAYELRRTLPLFAGDAFSFFSPNRDVLGFWRNGEDGSSACVLVNSSLQNPYDQPVPMRGEAVSEIISGYGILVTKATSMQVIDDRNPLAQSVAIAHLNQLGTAVLYFHPTQMLQKTMAPGLGILAHITSLPTKDGKPGTLGAPARAFVDWLEQAHVPYWQILPVNPTDEHGSPYAGISAFAGNTLLIEKNGTTDAPVTPDGEIDLDAYREFCEREADWLEPYATFMAIRQSVGPDIPWQKWPKKYRTYTSRLANSKTLKEVAESWKRAQFVFEQQWDDLHEYARQHGVQIIGDMPIYVSTDSSDVWAHPELFQLGPDGKPEMVAGCPPDSFAADGQVWGNPVYDWDALRETGYAWWLRRLERALKLYDIVRLDHFIGFSRYFRIPAGEKASAGAYCPGPGLDFFKKAFEKLGPLPIIAEDLGYITPCVRGLVAACGFPGMDIIQFADGEPLYGYTPRPEKITYTGTHDNQTLLGFCKDRYPEVDPDEAAEKLMRSVITCPAPVAILPLQDVLGLDDEARMNVPGVAEGNWSWQADDADVAKALEFAQSLSELHRESHA